MHFHIKWEMLTCIIVVAVDTVFFLSTNAVNMDEKKTTTIQCVQTEEALSQHCFTFRHLYKMNFYMNMADSIQFHESVTFSCCKSMCYLKINNCRKLIVCFC